MVRAACPKDISLNSIFFLIILSTDLPFLLTLTMIFQLAECEELAKNESELTFKLKKAELVVQQVCEFFVF